MTAFLYADPSIYIAQNQPTTAQFTVDIENVATSGTGNDIPAVMSPSENFQFMVQISDVDLADPLATAGSGFPVAATTVITSGDLTQALAAQAGAATFSGTASVTISPTQCATVQYICVELTAGSGALYTDAVTSVSSNRRCTDVTSNIICTPGMMSVS